MYEPILSDFDEDHVRLDHLETVGVSQVDGDVFVDRVFVPVVPNGVFLDAKLVDAVFAHPRDSAPPEFFVDVQRITLVTQQLLNALLREIRVDKTAHHQRLEQLAGQLRLPVFEHQGLQLEVAVAQIAYVVHLVVRIDLVHVFVFRLR